MIDHMSGGRVEFGTGRSAAYEQMGMGIDPRHTRAMWEESLRMIPRIWEDGPFSWEGQFWNVPPRDVRPKPYQRPGWAPPHAGRTVKRDGNGCQGPHLMPAPPTPATWRANFRLQD
jgi:alkanesulfonate monooxygenase SsuD/methylene tetrahydromethanopterin reductase-like flavin-dependent oxidoreductase (luciferase family)